MSDYPRPFGSRLAEARVKAGLSQRELGEVVGKTQTAVSYWESGRGEPNLTDLATLATKLDHSLDWLVRGIPDDKFWRGVESGLNSVGEAIAKIREGGSGAGVVKPPFPSSVPSPRRSVDSDRSKS